MKCQQRPNNQKLLLVFSKVFHTKCTNWCHIGLWTYWYHLDHFIFFNHLFISSSQNHTRWSLELISPYGAINSHWIGIHYHRPLSTFSHGCSQGLCLILTRLSLITPISFHIRSKYINKKQLQFFKKSFWNLQYSNYLNLMS